MVRSVRYCDIRTVGELSLIVDLLVRRGVRYRKILYEKRKEKGEQKNSKDRPRCDPASTSKTYGALVSHVAGEPLDVRKVFRLRTSPNERGLRL